MTDTARQTRGAAITRQRLLVAALEAFSTSGYDGASAREIERRAGVERSLIAYHFGSKEKLWEAAVDDIFNQFTDDLLALREALRDVSRHERARAMMLAFVRFNAEHPEFFRILILEGHNRSNRSRHMARHLRRGMAVFSDLPVDDASSMTLKRTMTMFQLLGAAGTLFATTSLQSPGAAELLMTPQAKEQFAQAVTTVFLDQSELTDTSAPN